MASTSGKYLYRVALPIPADCAICDIVTNVAATAPYVPNMTLDSIRL
ncbi:hypothetical protein QFZ79_004461 [Arthrobacter sp. V4I6]|nr:MULTISPECIES: hypothetical protein [unclassified Arthrobacter]MDQ0822082.1 hypothetical protein [Arthrobacter sp. V1I7]MDQ0856350.1 hypothetical protein [Arthrobacter sp. V4I6]